MKYSISAGCASTYVRMNQCEVPKDLAFYKIINETTRGVCKKICAFRFDQQCSGFFFKSYNRSCILVSFKGDLGQYCDTNNTLEFHKRERCLGKHT